MSEELVVVESVAGNLEGEILKGLLEAQGVSAILRGEGAASAIGLGVGRMARVDILVPESQEQEARQVLEDYYAGKFEED
jgi:hypothetical protein